MNNIGFALLGLLARDDLSGYDLSRRLKMPLGFFWQAGHSQIYPELAKLAGRGFVRERTVVQAGRPNKKVYSITPAGKAVLLAWVALPPGRTPPRDELLLKTYSIWLSPPAEGRKLFAAEAEAHAKRLAEYEGYREQMERGQKRALRSSASPHFATYATLMRGISFERAYVAWCRWMIKSLSRPAARTRKRQ
jgi:DNA-binding PadR family transcriptional regulator